MNRWRVGAVVLAACAAAGCAHVRPALTRAPTPLPADVAAYYDYPRRPVEPSRELLAEHADYTVELVRWPLADTTPPQTGDETIEVEWYESRRPGQRPAVVVLPILGGDYPIERLVCRFFADRGIHCALVHRRTLKFTTAAEPAELETLLRLAVVRNRQVLDWLQQQPSVAAGRLGIFGISMGALIGVATTAVEPRVQALVAGLAGGSIADILCDTRDAMLTTPRDRYLAAHALSLEALHRRLDETVRTDPLRLAPYVDGGRTLQIIARVDRTIRRPHSIALREALGRPETLWLPLGHYSSLLAIPYVETQSLWFYRRVLGGPPATPPRRSPWRGPGPHGIMGDVPSFVP